MPARIERPRSAKHGMRPSAPEPFMSRQNDYNAIHGGSGNTIDNHSPLESDFDLEERMLNQRNAINRPKSAKSRGQRTVPEDLTHTRGQGQDDLAPARPKSAKHGRRARTHHEQNEQRMSGNDNSSFDPHRHQRDQRHQGTSDVRDQRIEGIEIPNSTYSEDLQTPRDRPVMRPKSAGGRRRPPPQEQFTTSNCTSPATDTRMSRPKSAHHSHFRRPKFTQDDLDDYDSACELDLETLILDDKDGCITFNTGVEPEQLDVDQTGASISSNESDNGGRVAPTPFNSYIDKRIVYTNSNQGNQINNHEYDAGYHANGINFPGPVRPNSPTMFDFEEDSNSGDSAYHNYSGSPGSGSGMLRIKRKHLRRRFMSSPDSGQPLEESEFQINDRPMRKDLSDPSLRSGSFPSQSDPWKHENTAKNVAEKVVQKYKRRASTDTQSLQTPSHRDSQVAIGYKLSPLESQEVEEMQRRKSLPAAPRKLRPIYPRGRTTDSDSSADERRNSDPFQNELQQVGVPTPRQSHATKRLTIENPSIIVSDDSDHYNSPHVPRKGSLKAKSDPLLPAAGKRQLQPIRPLKIEVNDSDDSLSINSDAISNSPPDSAFRSMPTSPRNIPNPNPGLQQKTFDPADLPTVGAHRNFEPGVPYDGSRSRKGSLVASPEEAVREALEAHRDELLLNTPRRKSDSKKPALPGPAPLGDVGKKALCHTRSAPENPIYGQS